MGSALLFSSFFILLVLGMPVAYAMGASALIVLLVLMPTMPLALVPHQMVASTDSFLLLSVPLFVFAGELMNAGGLTKRLIRFSACFVGHVRGGLAYVVVLANMIMSGLSGSATADASATGSVLIPSMVREGYDPKFSAAVTAAAATIGPIIPPSIPMVVLAAAANVSVGKLFLAGILPGVLIGIYLMAVVRWIAKKRNYPMRPRVSAAEFRHATVDAVWSLLGPVVVLGSIVAGIATPTEASAVAVLYAMAVGLFIHRDLRWGDIPRLAANSAMISGTVLIIFAASGIMGWEVAHFRVSDQLMDGLLSISQSPWFILLLINIFFLVLACFLDELAIIIILVPVLMPLALKVGIDPTHFALVVIVNLAIGYVTPPIGYLLFIGAAIARVPVEHVAREVMPFIGALILALLVCTYWPAFVMWLPNMLMK